MEEKNNLKTLRKQVDSIDQRIVDLLSKRAKIASEIAKIKTEIQLPVFSPEREHEILSDICYHNDGPLDNDALQRIFKRIIHEMKILELKK